MHADRYDFSKIAKYFEGCDQSDALQVISDRTVEDVQLHEVFQFLDHTRSKVGQQFFYAILRTIPKSSRRTDKLEQLIAQLERDEKFNTLADKQLRRLGKWEAYYLPILFTEELIKPPKWFGATKLLFAVTLLMTVMAFFWPPLLVALLVLAAVNMTIHYWNKRNLYQYATTVLQLLVLKDVAWKICKQQGAEKNVNNALRSLDKLGYKLSPFKLEAALNTEIGMIVEYFFELVKSVFLVEPLLLFHVLEELEEKKNNVKEIFEYVGEIDVACALLVGRRGLPVYCEPEITEGKSIEGNGLYHPLIVNCVPNDLHLTGRSGLFTGSNMSGKSTFIRITAVNAICALTINTCFAKSFRLPRLRIKSAIKMSDSLMDDKSYFAEEVSVIKEMLHEVDNGRATLFLLDELFKGTNTIERIAAGKAVADYLNTGENIVLLSTHDLELADLLANYECFHFTEMIDGKSIIFDYKLKNGVLQTTNAIRILSLNGFPANVVQDATRVASELLQSKQ